MANNIRGIKCLERLHNEKFNIVAVVVKYSNNITENSVEKKALGLGYKILKYENINSELAIQEIKNLNIDLIVMSGFTQILKKGILSIPKLGTINLHGGKLPEYRGSSPINWQIINNEKMVYCGNHYNCRYCILDHIETRNRQRRTNSIFSPG